jgi:hypothetical protein
MVLLPGITPTTSTRLNPPLESGGEEEDMWGNVQLVADLLREPEI